MATAAKKKPAKKAPAKKSAKAKAPRVIETMIELLQKASASKPILRADLIAEIAKRTGRNASSVGHTVSCQLSRIPHERKLDVKKNENGYWIAK